MFSSTSLSAQQQQTRHLPPIPPRRVASRLLLPSHARWLVSLLSSPTLGISIVSLIHPRNHQNNTNEYTLTPVPFHSGTDPSFRPLPAVHDLDFQLSLSSDSQPHPNRHVQPHLFTFLPQISTQSSLFDHPTQPTSSSPCPPSPSSSLPSPGR